MLTFRHLRFVTDFYLPDRSIGDLRGPDQDRQNMADILSTLSGYDIVHGILILLKSNNARLTITFRYCVKELFTHLHQDAAATMAFGLTNTRISNYTPGDTYGPLKALLEQHPDVGLRLATPTTYCFDSESFRYLTAYKNGVTMPNKLDFDRSWSQSREETIRLINHFQSIPPHEFRSTLNVNGARRLIGELTKPLVEISQIVHTNIRLVEDQVEALKNARIKGGEKLADHADDITLKQTAVKQLEERVSEYRQEHEIIRVAAAKLCVFLKNNSLAPYNDALIASLDLLIKEEQAKVQWVGGNDKRLLSLTKERQKHAEAIEVILAT
jgi:hypothetical protein